MDITKIAKQIEEVSLAYAKKFKIKRDADWFMMKLQEEMGELMQSYLMMTERARKKGLNQKELRAKFAEEMADVFSHIILLAEHEGIDLEEVVNKKWLVWTEK